MRGVPISRRTGQVAQTPYAVGFDTGAAGHPFYAVSYAKAEHRDEYRRGWFRGYYDALGRELAAYNARAGASYHIRGPLG